MGFKNRSMFIPLHQIVVLQALSSEVDKMPTMEAFRKHRGMPFVKRGMRVFNTHYNRHGRVTSANASGNLNIRFDNETRTVNCHPNWMMDYLDEDGNVVASYHD